MLLTCVCTVSSEMPQPAAISRFRSPRRISSSISTSRAGQHRARGPTRELRLHLGAHRRLETLVHLADGMDQVRERRVLEQVGGRAGLQRAEDVLVALEHRQHDDAGRRIDARGWR